MLFSMKKLVQILLFIFLIIISLGVNAQEKDDDKKPLMHRQVYILVDNDTIPLFALRQVHVFAPMKFKNRKEKVAYSKLVRDVRKTYPYARMIARSVIETYEFMETLPNEKAKQKHLEAVQKYMMDEYKPHMKKMTRTQGQILIKLIDRECNITSYTIVKALLGDFRAGVYNAFAGLFGNSLKAEYDPQGKDANIERIVIQLQEGTLDYYHAMNYAN